VFSGDDCTNLLYWSICMVEDDCTNADKPKELPLDAEEGEDPHRTRSVCEHRLNHGGNTLSNSKTAMPFNKRWRHGGGGVKAEVALLGPGGEGSSWS
jgi:hypothetical protein